MLCGKALDTPTLTPVACGAAESGSLSTPTSTSLAALCSCAVAYSHPHKPTSCLYTSSFPVNCCSSFSLSVLCPLVSVFLWSPAQSLYTPLLDQLPLGAVVIVWCLLPSIALWKQSTGFILHVHNFLSSCYIRNEWTNGQMNEWLPKLSKRHRKKWFE